MASKRDLKKDITLLIEQVISDALDVAGKQEKEADQKAVLDVIIELTELHNQLIDRSNHPDGKDDPKLVKKHYRKIIEDLLAGCDNAYQKLGKIAA
ncbi:hypothetical protein [Roseimarinus sediminis]|uniref:hypothetical protein n=1 Tax=Roseimarinus sediminis TaxID=1610899 RepID=UPI003D246B98